MFLALVVCVLAGPARAGERHTVWAYPPGAGPKGSVEVETWITATTPTSSSPTESEYRVEIENGLTDDVSLDVYLGVLTQTPEEGFKFDRVQASLRANLLPAKTRSAIDLTGYFEVERDIQLSNPWELEMILIGGKSYGRFSYDFNMVVESELSSSVLRTARTEYRGIAGAWWELTGRLWAGAELMAQNDKGTRKLSIGPTLSATLTPKTWIAVGPQFGIGRDSDNLQVRAIFGIFF